MIILKYDNQVYEFNDFAFRRWIHSEFQINEIYDLFEILIQFLEQHFTLHIIYVCEYKPRVFSFYCIFEENFMAMDKFDS